MNDKPQRKPIEPVPPGTPTSICIVCGETRLAGKSGFESHHDCPKRFDGARKGVETRIDRYGVNRPTSTPLYGQRLADGFALVKGIT